MTTNNIGREREREKYRWKTGDRAHMCQEVLGSVTCDIMDGGVLYMGVKRSWNLGMGRQFCWWYQSSAGAATLRGRPALFFLVVVLDSAAAGST